MMRTRLALFQMESIWGDCAQNAAKILDCCAQAASQADIFITPELALSGWMGDYFLNADFVDSAQKALEDIMQKSKAQFPNLSIILGMPFYENAALYNAAVWIKHGSIQKVHCKNPIGFETRFFQKKKDAHNAPLFVNDVSITFTPNLGSQSVVLDSRAFDRRSLPTRTEGIYLNRVGFSAPFIFEGGSVAIQNGKTQWSAPLFAEHLAFLSFQNGVLEVPADLSVEVRSSNRVWDALVFGLRHYMAQNRFDKVALGLSGGLDSGVVLTLAVDALGPEKVHALILPSPYTSEESLTDALALLKNLKVSHTQMSIVPLMQAYEKVLKKSLGKIPAMPNETTFENLQARIRAQLLMAYSNRSGALILNTSNKSECAVGYSTLYGDLVGGVAPIKDLYKTEIFDLARYRNTLGEVIPPNMIEKAPSAELRPNQKDEDSLPPYAVLDAILEGAIENNLSFKALVEKGFEEETVREVLRLLAHSEYKRRQSPIGFLMSARGFDYNWHFPLGGFYGFYEQN